MKPKKIATSISFTQEQYDALQKLAEQRDVSIAAIVREAIQIYLEVENERL